MNLSKDDSNQKDRHKKTNYRLALTSLVHKRSFLIPIAAISVIAIASVILVANYQSPLPTAEAADAGLSITRWASKPNNPTLPLRNVTDLIRADDTRFKQFVSAVDSRFDPRIGEKNLASEFAIGGQEGLLLKQLIPFTYHDSDTFPEHDVYSTFIELDGKYYLVVLSLPKPAA